MLPVGLFLQILPLLRHPMSLIRVYGFIKLSKLLFEITQVGIDILMKDAVWVRVVLIQVSLLSLKFRSQVIDHLLHLTHVLNYL